MKPFLVVLYLLMAIPVVVLAQDADTTTAPKKYELPFKMQVKYADKLLEVGNYFDALEQYTQVLERKPDDSYAQYQIAECLRLSRNYKAALTAYQTVAGQSYANLFHDLYYYLGLMMQQTEDYAGAKGAFNTFLNDANGSEDLHKLAEIQVKACDLALAGMQDPEDYKITHLNPPVNHKKSELSPRVNGDVMYFASLNDDSTMNGEFYQDSMPPMAHIYKAKRTGDGWSSVEILNNPINSFESHSTGLAVSADGKRMYFTVCTGEGIHEIHCEIYLSMFENGKWSEAKPLEGINEETSNNTQPAIGLSDDNGDQLYFSSNRDGGNGGYDIYVAKVDKEGKASAPKNLGNTINTAWDEHTPYFWERKQKLFFSSDGLEGYGGFDNYVAQLDSDGNWGEPENLGYPINSGADDMGYSVGKDDRKEYYFVSNRPGIIGEMSETCCDDIFESYNMFEPTLAIAGTITEREDSVAVGSLEGVQVELYDITDGIPLLVASDSLTSGRYILPLKADRKYSIKYKRKEHFPVYKEFNTLMAENSDTIENNVFMDKIIINKSYVISKVYYAYKSARLTDDSKAALDTLYLLMTENPDIIVELSSHTDSVGSDKYNLQLSQDRAQSCVEYLLGLGIDSTRLKPVGYGETQPIAPNTIDGKDNPEGRAQNRRTEYKILGNLERKGDKVILE